MLRPGGTRRRRRPSGVRRSLGWLPLAVLAVVVVGLLVGALADIGARSADYRTTTDSGFGALATTVVQQSNRTGAELAGLMSSAPTLSNGALPFTARATLQQGLDAAAAAAVAAWHRAEDIAVPAPTDDVAAQFAAVMDERASAVGRLRSTLDQLLGMSPLPVAGSPSSDVVAPPGPLISADAASAAMAAVGTRLQRADARYRAMQASIRRQHEPVRLPPSTWVSSPSSSAPLGPGQLGALAPILSDPGSPLAPFHHLVVTAVGVRPPAVPAPPGSPALPGVIGVSCGAARSNPPGAAPTVLPPTPTLTVAVTVTNCGTVAESGIRVTTSLAVHDPAGAAPPPAGRRGGTRTTTVTLRSGGSVAFGAGPLPVAGGHEYLLTVSIALPPGQSAALAGAAQQMVLLVTA